MLAKAQEKVFSGVRFHLPDWAVPLSLFVLSIISYGLLIPSLGFYWDDWPSLMIIDLQGVEGFRSFFQFDRPTTFLSYILLVPLFGTDPLWWHIFTLLLRWLTAVILWWSLRTLWPESRDLPVWTAFLFLVYPVFRQQPIAMTYHQLWLEFVFFLFSIGAMIAAIRSSSRYWLWTSGALVGLIGNLLISEYFLGVELLRPVLLWLAVSAQYKGQRFSQSLKKVFLHWLPYLGLLLIYLAWRFYFIDLPGTDRNELVLLANLSIQPLSTLTRLVQMILQDVALILVTNWYDTFQPELFDLDVRFNLISLAIGLVSAVFCGIISYLRSTHEQFYEPALTRQVKVAVVLGTLLVLIAPLPAWVTGRQVAVGAHSDRLAVPAMLGASLFIAGLIIWFIRTRLQQILILSLFVGLAVGYNVRIANDYRWASIQVNRFYWQLYWRAPGIQHQTAFFANAEVLPKTGLYSTASGINIIYADQIDSGAVPYWFFSLSRQFGHRIPELLAGIPIESTFRHFTFQGESPNSLILFYDPGNADCLRIVSPRDRYDPDLPPLVIQALPISNLDRIITSEAETPPPSVDIFGPEPKQSWCYYFQKADLARQKGEWEQIVKLAEEAAALGFSIQNSQSNTPQEWLPFIEGYAHSKRWIEARDLSKAVIEKKPAMQPQLCDLWKAIQEDNHLPVEIEQSLQEIGCRP